MSTSVKVLAGVAGVAIVALGVARLATRAGCDSATPGPEVGPEPTPSEEGAAEPEWSEAGPTPEYGQIVERDVFGPLVAPSRASGAGEGGGESGPLPAAERSARGERPEPEKPADPLADLALTGIVQAGQDLQALIETVSTRVGRYVRVGDEISGFRVAGIREGAVVLERDGTQYTLCMGDRELPDTPGSAASQEHVGAQQTTGSTQPTGAPSGPPTGITASGEFGSDMLQWAERTPLPQLERMYDRYSGYVSPEQRRQADEYIQDRRRREGR